MAKYGSYTYAKKMASMRGVYRNQPQRRRIAKNLAKLFRRKK